MLNGRRAITPVITRRLDQVVWSSQHSPGSGIVAEAMGLGFVDAGGPAMMPEQRAQTGRGHASGAGAALQGNEQRGRWDIGSLQPEVVIQKLDGFGSQGQQPGLVSLATDTDLRLREQHVVAVESDHLPRAQTLQQHQSDDGQVARGAKARPESRDFVYREGTMARLASFTRRRLRSGVGRPRPMGARRQKVVCKGGAICRGASGKAQRKARSTTATR